MRLSNIVAVCLAIGLPSCARFEERIVVPALPPKAGYAILLRLPRSGNFWSGGLGREGERVRFKGSIVVKNRGTQNARVSFYDKCASALEKDMGTLELAPQAESSVRCNGECVGFSMPAGGYLLEVRFIPASAMSPFYVGVVSVPDVP